ncbi:hypothetical protein niasHT_011201 [Heterodera trifolii]|uniref:Uncharacterized protein n=1 Tax=Heterodera trifolii TaxID=157864 RepID=A0ABD2LD24_9BILA
MRTLTHLYKIILILSIALPISTRGKGPADALGNGITDARGNGWMPIEMAHDNVTIIKLSANTDQNGPTNALGNVLANALGNASANALGNASANALGNASANALGNASANALGNASANALGNASANALGTTDARGNGWMPIQMAHDNVTIIKLSANTDQNGSTNALGNASANALGNASANALGNASANALGNASANSVGTTDARGNGWMPIQMAHDNVTIIKQSANTDQNGPTNALGNASANALGTASANALGTTNARGNGWMPIEMAHDNVTIIKLSANTDQTGPTNALGTASTNALGTASANALGTTNARGNGWMPIEMAHDNVTIIKLSANTDQTGPTNALGNASANALGNASANALGTTNARGNGWMPIEMAHDNVTIIKLSANTDQTGPTNALGNASANALGTASANALGTTNARGNGWMPIEMAHDNVTIIKQSANTDQNGPTNALGNASANALGTASANALGTTNARGNGWMPIEMAHDNVTIIKLSANTDQTGPTNALGTASTNALGTASANALGTTNARGNGWMPIEMAHDNVTIIKLSANTDQTGPTNALGNASANALGNASANSVGTTDARGNGWMPIQMAHDNVTIIKQSANTDQNGSTNALGNASANALGNASANALGTTNARGNGWMPIQMAHDNVTIIKLSANTDQTGPTNALGNASANALGTASANALGTTNARGNGWMPIEMAHDNVTIIKLSANTDQTGPTNALGNASANSVGTTDARGNGWMPIQMAHDNVTIIKLSANTDQTGPTNALGTASTNALGTASANALGTTNARGNGSMPIEMAHDNVTIIKLSANTDQTGPTNALGNASANALGNASANSVGTTDARGNGWMPIQMAHDNVTIIKQSANTDQNGSTNALGNASANALGNASANALGTTNARGNGWMPIQMAHDNVTIIKLSANTDQTGPTNALGNASANALGTASANALGTTNARGNGWMPIEMAHDNVTIIKLSANTDQTGPTNALGNASANSVGTTDARGNGWMPIQMAHDNVTIIKLSANTDQTGPTNALGNASANALGTASANALGTTNARGNGWMPIEMAHDNVTIIKLSANTDQTGPTNALGTASTNALGTASANALGTTNARGNGWMPIEMAHDNVTIIKLSANTDQTGPTNALGTASTNALGTASANALGTTNARGNGWMPIEMAHDNVTIIKLSANTDQTGPTNALGNASANALGNASANSVGTTDARGNGWMPIQMAHDNVTIIKQSANTDQNGPTNALGNASANALGTASANALGTTNARGNGWMPIEMAHDNVTIIKLSANTDQTGPTNALGNASANSVGTTDARGNGWMPIQMAHDNVTIIKLSANTDQTGPTNALGNASANALGTASANALGTTNARGNGWMPIEMAHDNVTIIKLSANTDQTGPTNALGTASTNALGTASANALGTTNARGNGSMPIEMAHDNVTIIKLSANTDQTGPTNALGNASANALGNASANSVGTTDARGNGWMPIQMAHDNVTIIKQSANTDQNGSTNALGNASANALGNASANALGTTNARGNGWMPIQMAHDNVTIIKLSANTDQTGPTNALGNASANALGTASANALGTTNARGNGWMPIEMAHDNVTIIKLSANTDQTGPTNALGNASANSVGTTDARGNGWMPIQMAHDNVTIIKLSANTDQTGPTNALGNASANALGTASANALGTTNARGNGWMPIEMAHDNVTIIKLSANTDQTGPTNALGTASTNALGTASANALGTTNARGNGWMPIEMAHDNVTIIKLSANTDQTGPTNALGTASTNALGTASANALGTTNARGNGWMPIEMAHDNVTIIKLSANTDQTGPTNALGNASANALGNASANSVGTTDARGNGWMPIQMAHDNVTIIKQSANTDQNGPTNALGNASANALGTASANALGTTNARGNGWMPIEMAHDNVTIIKLSANTDQTGPTNALGTASTNALGTASANALGTTNARGNGWMPIEMAHDNVTIIKLSANTDQTGPTNALGNASANALGTASANALGTTNARGNGWMPIEMAHDNVTIIKLSANTDQTGPTNALGTASTNALGTASANALGTTNARGNGWMPIEMAHDNVTIIKLSANTDQTGPTNALGTASTNALGTASANALGTTNARGNGWMPIEMAHDNVTIIKLSANTDQTGPTNALGNASANALGTASANALGTTNARGNGWMPIEMAHDNVTIIKLSANTDQTGPTNALGTASTNALGTASANALGTTNARGNGWMPIEMAHDNVTIIKQSANTDQNGSTNALGNASANALGNASANALGNASANALGNASANALGNASANALGNASANSVGTTDVRGNGWMPIEMAHDNVTIIKLSANTDQNGPVDAVENGPFDVVDYGPVDDVGNGLIDAVENGPFDAAVLKIRRKRVPALLLAAVPLAKKFAVALLVAAGKEIGKNLFSGSKIKDNPAADGYSDSKQFYVSEECKRDFNCTFFACHPNPDADGDSFCRKGFTRKCCQEYNDGEKKLDAKLEKCFYNFPICGESGCVSERNYYTVKSKDGKVEIIPYAKPPPECAFNAQASMVGVKYYYPYDYGEGVQETIKTYVFMYDDDNGCKKCGWRICYKTINVIEEFVCTCCDQASFSGCQWQWTDICHYQPDTESDSDTLRCPGCNWKIRYSKNAFSCCDIGRLQNCTNLLVPPKHLSLVPEKKVESITLSPVSDNDTCLQLQKEKCDCGWGNCTKREGRVANTCCMENFDMVCCVGDKPGSSAALQTVPSAKALTAFVLMMVVLKMVKNRIVDANLWEN